MTPFLHLFLTYSGHKCCLSSELNVFHCLEAKKGSSSRIMNALYPLVVPTLNSTPSPFNSKIGCIPNFHFCQHTLNVVDLIDIFYDRFIKALMLCM